MSALLSVESLLRNYLEGTLRIVDVRAPIEFSAGSIPGSLNLPILKDEERARVGTTYKQKGREAALALGFHLIQGEIKAERLNTWISECERASGQTVLTCFRGGLRSQIAQQWLAEAGFKVARIEGGYKQFRQRFLLEIQRFTENSKLLVLTGKTGSGKTELLRSQQNFPFLDLEDLAQHRGSAFGQLKSPQPSQIDFENRLALELLRLESDQIRRPVLIEDECRLIGRSVQPPSLFDLLRRSPVLILEEPLSVRVENTWKEYVVSCLDEKNLFSRLSHSVEKLAKKLGGQRCKEILNDISQAEMAWTERRDATPSKVWIEKLLLWYYDPAYDQSLATRKPEILIRGDRTTLSEFLRSRSSEFL